MIVELYAHAPVEGGLIEHVARLALGLRERGIDAGVVLSPSSALDARAAALAGAGVDVARITVAGKGDLRGARALARRVAARQPDVVHVHLASPFESVPALVAARLGGAGALVTTEHAPGWHPLERRHSRALKRLVARSLGAVIAVSATDAALLAGAFGLPSARVTVVPNGVPDQRVAIGRSAARAAFGLGDGPVAGCVSALEENKGLLDLAAAARELGITVAVAGDGSLSTLLAPDLRVLGRVADVPAFLAALDVFVFPSWQEALPLALLEAMSAGLPIVATRVGGIPEALADGAAGLLVPPREPAALAAGIARLLGDRDLAARLGSAARERWEREYRSERMIDRILEVYRTCQRRAR